MNRETYIRTHNLLMDRLRRNFCDEEKRARTFKRVLRLRVRWRKRFVAGAAHEGGRT